METPNQNIKPITTKTNERITLANLAEQDLLVYNGSKILGYSYQEVDTSLFIL